LKGRLAIASTVLAAVAAAASAVAGATVTRGADNNLRGAGSSFVNPLVSTWIPAVKADTGLSVSYSPIGSGGGIAAISNRQVDFGASDAPLTPDQFRGCKGCVQIPWALSATSVAYNLGGAPVHLKISGKVLADIYLGKITRWNDARIERLNKGARLPSQKITPIYRSDSSGTTYNFTEYLSSASPEFRSKVGKGTLVNFPAGVGGRGSSGVSGVLKQTDGGIMYADVAYAVQGRFKFFAVQNRAGKYTLPGIVGIKAAAAGVSKVGASNEISIVNPAKKFSGAYPISTYTYVIIPLQTASAPELKRFVTWALTKGQPLGVRLRFVPVPRIVLSASQKTLRRIHT
jgi:phosphate transport system substrate-binding protein